MTQPVNKMTATALDRSKPWYREPWPWLLMAGPAIVIVAGLVTAWLAVSSSDGLVSEDYYKQGLAAGETLARNQRAEELGITAGVSMTRETMRIRLSAAETFKFPASVSVALSHPTRAGLDQRLILKRVAEEYQGEMLLPASGHWIIVIEDEDKSWRLTGSIMLPIAKETVIGGKDVAAKPKS